MENAYIEYYTVQIGSGLKDIGPLYHNYRFVQQGRGFGSFFETLFSYLKPVFKSGVNALKDSALKTGSSILSEIGSRPLNEIFIDHGKQFGQDLGSKLKRKFQDGSGLMFAGAAKTNKVFSKGIKVKQRKKNNQSSLKRKQRKLSKRKLSKRKLTKNKSNKKSKNRKTRILDIFAK